jgi:hypothetical protein
VVGVTTSSVTAVLVTVTVDISKVQMLVAFVPGQIPVRGISMIVVHCRVAIHSWQASMRLSAHC